jgi:hypothetical protein
MPADFLKCVNSGGKVVTKQLKGNKYIHICYDKKGNSHVSEVKTKKKSKTKSNKNQTLLKDSKALRDELLKLKEHFDTNYKN